MDFTVRVGQEEIGRILNLRENLDQRELLVNYAARYQQLGWVLAAVAGPGQEADLDFNQPPALWARKLADLGLAQAQVNVGIRTGRASQLLVLEVNKGQGALALEELGDWRAECVAAVGESREQHYFALPPEGPWPASFFLAPQVMVYGEGGLVSAPPSLEPQSREPWRWLKPPWEHLPKAPGAAVWQFLKEHLPETILPATREETPIPSWEEIYRLISPWDTVLRALLAPAPSPEEYYERLLKAARAEGLVDQFLLFGLLWHAPLGDASQRPERWKYLQELVADGAPHRRSPAPQESAGSGGAARVTWTCTWDQNPKGPHPAGARFDRSLAGQFFQLLAGLGEQVITETCRHEALRLKSGLAGSAGEPLTAPSGTDPLGLWEEEQQTRSRYFQEVQAATNEFLKNHPDLAGDQSKVQMVLLCLKNYVNLDPEFAEVPVKAKLERAAQLAREFLEEMD
jgi:hypothetical protein